MNNDIQPVVAAFLDGMYYAGHLPSKREITAIAAYLSRRQLNGTDRSAVELQLGQSLATLHARIDGEQKS